MTHRERCRALAALLPVVIALSACAPTSLPELPSTRAADLLWLPEGARVAESRVRPSLLKNGRSIYEDGRGVVGFDIEANCDAIVDALVSHFESHGWHRRATQKRNSHMATSFERGCQEFRGGGVIMLGADGRQIPRRGPIIDWHGEWENEHGDIVIYTINSVGTEGAGSAEFLPRDAWK